MYECVYVIYLQSNNSTNNRGGSRAAATSKMECVVKIVNGWKPLTIITKRSILDVVAALDPPLNKFVRKLYGQKVAMLMM